MEILWKMFIFVKQCSVTECNAAKLHVGPDSNVIFTIGYIMSIFRKKYSLLIKLSARAFYVVIKKYF